MPSGNVGGRDISTPHERFEADLNCAVVTRLTCGYDTLLSAVFFRTFNILRKAHRTVWSQANFLLNAIERAIEGTNTFNCTFFKRIIESCILLHEDLKILCVIAPNIHISTKLGSGSNDSSNDTQYI